MIIIDFFILLIGIFGYNFLKIKDKRTTAKIKTESRNRLDNVKVFMSRYVDDGTVEYNIKKKLKEFFINKSLGREIDITLVPFYDIAVSFPKMSNRENSYRENGIDTIMLSLILAKEYGLIRERHNKIGYYPDEYPIAMWVKENICGGIDSKLYALCDEGSGVVEYFWEKSSRSIDLGYRDPSKGKYYLEEV